MDRPDSTENARQCTALILGFFRFLDRGDYSACCECFEEDGVWERQGDVLEGRMAIAGALHRRSPDRRTVHLVNNVDIEFLSPASAQGRFVLVAYEGDNRAQQPEPEARLAGIRSCVDELTLTQEGWRIARKRSSPLFRGSA